MREMENAMNILKVILDRYIQRGMIVVDCTAGNGKDTLYLKERLGDSGYIYAMDVQSIAIKNTEKLLVEKGNLSNVKLINDSHEFVDKYVYEKVDLLIYNLGYLPGGPKEIRTTYQTTITSLKKGMEILKKGGLIGVVSNHGNKDGSKELSHLLEFLSELDQNEYNVSRHNYINQVNHPPELLIIEKR